MLHLIFGGNSNGGDDGLSWPTRNASYQYKIMLRRNDEATMTSTKAAPVGELLEEAIDLLAVR